MNIGNAKFQDKQLCEGIHVFGATGSGKTSGPLKDIRHYLANRFGGIVLCAKSGEATEWDENLVEPLHNRINMSDVSFNFMDWASTQDGGGETENLVDLFLTISEVVNRDEGGKKDSYWENAMKQMLRNAFDLLKLTDEKVSILNVKKVVDYAPAKGHKGGYTTELLNRLGDCHTAEMVKAYWNVEFLRMGDKQKGGIISTFTSVADPLCRGLLAEKFSGDTTWTPEELETGQILFVDYSVKQHKAIGLICASIIKYCVQQYIEARPEKEPLFIYADEAQFFANKRDLDFQTTARSNGGITIYATQSMTNYDEVIGEKLTLSLLSNLRTSIFCANTDKKTNTYASDIVGTQLEIKESVSSNESKEKGFKLGVKKVHESKGSTVSESREIIIQPADFRTLRSGGADNRCIVDCLIISPAIGYGWYEVNQNSTASETVEKEVNLNARRLVLLGVFIGIFIFSPHFAAFLKQAFKFDCSPFVDLPTVLLTIGFFIRPRGGVFVVGIPVYGLLWGMNTLINHIVNS